MNCTSDKIEAMMTINHALWGATKGVFLILIIILIGFGYFYTKKSLPNKVTNTSSITLGLKKITDIPLGGSANRLDYQSINYGNNRLYISHLGSNSVIAFDLTNHTVIKDIPVASSPYGILVVPELHTVYVGIGGDNSVAVIDENTLQVTKYIQAGKTPDGLAYDPSTNKLFVSNENGGTVTVINTSNNERIEDISIGGSVGNTHYDPISQHIFSVSGQENTLVEINPATDNIIKTYETVGCSHPHGFYLDEKTHYAFITCQGNNKMIVVDLNAKKIIYTDTVGVNPDVLAFDPGLHRLYVAAESGIITIFDIKKNNIAKIGQAFLADKAHTVSVNKNNHEVYFPLEKVNGKAVLRILKSD